MILGIFINGYKSYRKSYYIPVAEKIEDKKIIAVGCIAYNVILLMQMYKYKWKDKNDYKNVKKHNFVFSGIQN